MTGQNRFFAATYAQARNKFLRAASDAGLAVQSHIHPLLGSQSETLAMDVVRDGPADAQALLVISSACHGVEGYAGSAVQVALLRDASWRARVADSGAAVLYIHALNPHGFSWTRRVTEHNVDLNRNFQDFSRALPLNAAYDEVAQLLLPSGWPPDAAVQAQIQNWIAKHGVSSWHAAVASGQYRHPAGLFFGGSQPSWSNLTLRRVLREQAGRCARLGWMDIHTGLGPTAQGERIHLDRDDRASLARAQDWWGQAVTSCHDGSSSSPPITGLLWSAIREECSQAQYTGIALEFGTVPATQVLQALRADHWLHAQATRPDARTAQPITQALREAFEVDSKSWRHAVIEQAREAALQGLAGLELVRK